MTLMTLKSENDIFKARSILDERGLGQGDHLAGVGLADAVDHVETRAREISGADLDAKTVAAPSLRLVDDRPRSGFRRRVLHGHRSRYHPAQAAV